MSDAYSTRNSSYDDCHNDYLRNSENEYADMAGEIEMNCDDEADRVFGNAVDEAQDKYDCCKHPSDCGHPI